MPTEYRSTITVFESHSPNFSFYFLTSTNCLFPNDQWMSATFQMIYLLKDEKLLGNRSSNHFIWDWKGKRGKKDCALYFPHGIHKFDFPIWIQSGESTLTGILRFPSDNYWKDILSTVTKNCFDIVFFTNWKKSDFFCQVSGNDIFNEATQDSWYTVIIRHTTPM